MTEAFDLITLGAGSGGVAASRRAALHGARVAIVEGGRVGGTCVLRGCVPKKLLMYAAQFGDDFAEARGYGWEMRRAALRDGALGSGQGGRDGAPRGRLSQDAGRRRRRPWSKGWAQLDGPDTGAGGRALAAGAAHPDRHRRVTGARQHPRHRGLRHQRTSCSTSTACPASVAVIGGGYIAVEFASMLVRLGAQVALFYRDRLPLRGFDEMLRTAAAAELQAAGVELHPGVVPRRVQRVAEGFLLELGDDRVREFPWVLNATGRRPNSAGLGLPSVGVATDAAGAVPIDGAQRTAAPGVYAIGDVTQRKNLTPVAIAEGRALADSLFGGQPREVDLSRVASAVFMLPPIATVGPSEEQALAAGRGLKVFETDFRPMKQAFVGGHERTRMKLLVDAGSDRVLAVHMIGTDAPEIVQSLAVALSAGATKADFDRTIAMHPTAAEEFVLLREPARMLVATAPPQAAAGR